MPLVHHFLSAQEKSWVRRVILICAAVVFCATQLHGQPPAAVGDGPSLNSPLTKKWSMVIRPGALDHDRHTVAPHLVEFEYDPADKRLVKPPEVLIIDESQGAPVAIQPAAMIPQSEAQTPTTLVPPCPEPCLAGDARSRYDISPAEALEKARLYEQLYDLIGFSRAEYLANPSFRHEAVIQLLLGQPIPKTINTTVASPATPGGAFRGGVDGYLGNPAWDFPISTQSGTYLYPYHSPYYLWQNYPHLTNRPIYSPWLSRYPFGNPGRYYY